MSPRAGGKAVNLAYLMAKGFHVPGGICITTDAYNDLMHRNGLTEQIQMELARRDVAEMRWEELWDASLRIRSLFNQAKINPHIVQEISKSLGSMAEVPVVVRSSAPGEDEGGSSFAGLHESYVNVLGIDSIIEHVKLVWASLWSDRALMYRKELGLDPMSSKMAVIIQELLPGDVSGVGFSMSPLEKSHAVLEVVRGLNKGLVDGDISPEQWVINRTDGTIARHHEGDAAMTIVAPEGGTMVKAEAGSGAAVLEEKEVITIFTTLMELENHLGFPVDVEWTMREDMMYLLQVRPVTALENDGGAGKPWESDDKRGWYKSLTMSYGSLQKLRIRIENELIPAMNAVAGELDDIDPAKLDDLVLADEIVRRQNIYLEWRDVYWADFIPFAHGVRIFGQVYNDMLLPSDPYRFTRLLTSEGMISVERNRLLSELANRVRQNPMEKLLLERHEFEKVDPSLLKQLDEFIERYTDTLFQGQRLFQGRDNLVQLLLTMVNSERGVTTINDDKSRKQLEQEYYNAFPEKQREFAEQLLELGRASWRLRDNDNLYLGKIEAQLSYAFEEGRRRLAEGNDEKLDKYRPEEVAMLLRGEKPHPGQLTDAEVDEPLEKDITGIPEIPAVHIRDGKYRMSLRQFTGQPAGPGVGSGLARVINSNKDLFEFSEGEVIICDAIDPAMTFVIPLASGIVERRGGMLIHGAIIAREYGIPCVTGIDNATSTISNGVHVTVDGYLGIVTIRDL